MSEARRPPGVAAVPGPIHPLLESGTEYPFVRLARRRAELVPPGVSLIDFGAGDPRERTPDFIREALREGVPEISTYPSVVGLAELRAACAAWAARRFGARLDPATQVLPLNGSKEGVFLLALAVIGRDASGAPPARDTVVIPTPAYPVYAASAGFAGAATHQVPLRAADGWRFDPDQVPDEVWRRTALVWLNTPHNPTGAVVPRATMERLAARARAEGFWIASDEAYAEVYFDARPPSMLECGAENVIVFHTLSKRSAMTGFRSGFMAGDARLIDALRRMRPNVGVATPEFVQRAAIAAWKDEAHAEDLRAGYAARRALMRDGFAKLGWAIEASEASFYLWARAPGGDDVAFVERLMKLGILATPGSFMGRGGEGYVRWALVQPIERCREALARIAAAGEDAFA